MNKNGNIGIVANQREKTRRLVLLAMLLALTLLLAFVPSLGYITFGPVSITTIHIPVIIGAIILGPAAGAFLGGIFGLTSIIMAPILAPLTAFMFNPFVQFGNFNSIIIAMVPRILVGVVAGYLYKLVKIKDKSGYFAALAAGIGGALTNSILVLGGFYVFFGHHLASVLGKQFSGLMAFLMGLFITNSIIETVFAAIVVTAVTKAMFVYMKRRA